MSFVSEVILHSFSYQKEMTNIPNVVASIFGMHRLQTSVGFDADSWQPDRWKEWTPPEGEFIPFSTGPRSCLGRSFAQFQMEYIIVRLLQTFAGISYHGLEQQVKFEINTKPAYPVLCKFHAGLDRL